jgi:hypothetical protein
MTLDGSELHVTRFLRTRLLLSPRLCLFSPCGIVHSRSGPRSPLHRHSCLSPQPQNHRRQRAENAEQPTLGFDKTRVPEPVTTAIL